MKEQLTFNGKWFEEQARSSSTPSIYNFDRIRYEDKCAAEIELPVALVVIRNDIVLKAAKLTIVYDTPSEQFFVLKQSRGNSWKSIGLDIGSRDRIFDAIHNLHKERNLNSIEFDGCKILLSYARFLECEVTLITDNRNILVEIRYLYEPIGDKLIRAQIGKGNSYKALGIMDNGKAARIVARKQCQALLDKQEFNKIQSSFDF